MDPSPHDALLRFLYRAPIGLLQTDASGEIAMINPMSAQLLMPLVPNGDLLNLFEVLEAVAPDLRERAAATAASDGIVCDDLRFEVRAPESRGAVGLRTLALSLFKLDAETLVASINDVSLLVERERAQIRSTRKDASRQDPLTRLPNRLVAIERIAAALDARRDDAVERFAVIVVDCDRFDRVNVTLGPTVGDELLRAVGRRLNAALRPHAPLGEEAPGEPAAARLGADAFVLVVRDLADAAAAAAIARRIVDVLAEPYVIGEHIVHLTASLGVVEGDAAVGDPEEVLQSANIAMHEAKRAGGAGWSRFHPAMKDRAARRGSIESELRDGIAAGELFVVYQPILAFGGDRAACAGVEALVRWRHRVRGIVPPIDFIEIAEETGLIVSLGSFVLAQACTQLARWQRVLGSAAPKTVSVNVSKAQLGDGRFIDIVREALLASGLPAARLQLEVTESLAGRDENVRARLHELKALGVTIALDDFGTGYSSLSSLHQLPVDVVKIDRSFVSQLESSAHHRVLVEATVKVARSLGMSTVAEGIETPGQADELERLGCDKAQGYFFARPMEAEAAGCWLVERETRAERLSLPCAATGTG